MKPDPPTQSATSASFGGEEFSDRSHRQLWTCRHHTRRSLRTSTWARWSWFFWCRRGSRAKRSAYKRGLVGDIITSIREIPNIGPKNEGFKTLLRVWERKWGFLSRRIMKARRCLATRGWWCFWRLEIRVFEGDGVFGWWGTIQSNNFNFLIFFLICSFQVSIDERMHMFNKARVEFQFDKKWARVCHVI